MRPVSPCSRALRLFACWEVAAPPNSYEAGTARQIRQQVPKPPRSDIEAFELQRAAFRPTMPLGFRTATAALLDCSPPLPAHLPRSCPTVGLRDGQWNHVAVATCVVPVSRHASAQVATGPSLLIQHHGQQPAHAGRRHGPAVQYA